LLALEPAGASEGTGLSLETGSPDALCPDLSTTREAIGRRLGTLVAPQGSGWRARYTIGHAPEGTPRDFVRLELFGPDGALQLSRDLPLEASCATMADVIALVLDRHFRGIPAHDAEPAAPMPVGHAVAEPVDVTPEAIASDADARASALLVSAEVSARYPFMPRLGLRVMGAIGPTYLGLTLSSGLVSEQERLERGGSVDVAGLTLHGHAGWGPELGPVQTFIGPSLRLSVDRGSARGLPEGDTRYRAVSGVGAQAGAIAFIGDSWFVSLTGTADVTLEALSGRFVIDGRDVLAPSLIQGWTALGIGYAP
jgi:hypothetical protein